MTEQYHEAPHTLDADRDIDEDAPPSAGHDEDSAQVVRERDEAHTAAVNEAAERVAEHGEVGPREPGADREDEDLSDEERERREDKQESDERVEEQRRVEAEGQDQPGQEQAQPVEKARRKRGEPQ
jgi:hypothetical protein